MKKETKYQLYEKGEFSWRYKKIGHPKDFSDLYKQILNKAKEGPNSEKNVIQIKNGWWKNLIFKVITENPPRKSQKNLDTNDLFPEMIFEDSLNFPENFSYLQGTLFFRGVDFPKKSITYYKIKPVKYSSGGKD